jgi:hypothetical protein
LKSAKLAGWDEAMQDAAAGDVKRFELLKAKFSGNPPVCRRIFQQTTMSDVCVKSAVPPSGKVVAIRIKDAATGNIRGVFYVIFIPSVEDLNHEYALAVAIPDSTKIDTLIWREGPQFIGAKEGSRPLLLGKTIAELNLSGKTIEMSTASGGSPSSRPTNSQSQSQSQAVPPTTSPGNRTQAVPPTASPSNRAQTGTPNTSPSNRTQAGVPTASPGNRSAEQFGTSGRSRGEPDVRESLRKAGPEVPIKPGGVVRPI